MKNFVGYTGGHPLTLDNGLYIQAAAKEAIIALAKSQVPAGVTQAFLTGCVLTEGGGETSITDGWMLIGSDVYRVPAKTIAVTGASNLKLVLVTSTPAGYPATVNYQTGGPKEVYKETIVDFRSTGDGDGEGSPILLTSYIYRVNAAPRGEIKMFAPRSGVLSDYFTAGLGKGECLGYAMCDGSNGTPDLRGRFVVGYDSAVTDYNAIGKTGGAETVTLTTDQIPSHGHTMTLRSSDDSGGDTGTQGVAVGSADVTDQIPATDPTGGGQAHENRPPYYVLVFIQKL